MTAEDLPTVDHVWASCGNWKLDDKDGVFKGEIRIPIWVSTKELEMNPGRFESLMNAKLIEAMRKGWAAFMHPNPPKWMES